MHSATIVKPGQFTAMISSTARDLPEHRAAVKEACIAVGVFPIAMEHLPVRDASGITASLEMVDLADLYLGIYAWRYGWIPDGKDVSITEMEFDHAVERKAAGHLHELLIFTAHKKHPCTIEDIETGDVPQQKLASFKLKACTGRVRQEFSSAEELRRLVFEALHHFLQRHNSTPIPPHHNLPALQPFFGRENELRRIAEALAPGSHTWGVLINARAGMGKTSLAVSAAHNAPSGLFTRIVFVSLKSLELDDDAVRDLRCFILSGLAELFGELARQLGHTDISKSAEHERPRLLLDALAGTRTLLILDNLESLLKAERDALFTFVKRLPPGCKAILTCRGRIGSSTEEIILEKFSEAAALATLAELATRHTLLAQTSEAERLVLYRETAGMPLLLRWTAGQLGRGHSLTFADAIAHLRSCPEGNDALEFIFGDLAAGFTELETQVLCALTYFARPANAEHISAILSFDTTQAKTGWAVPSPPPDAETDSTATPTKINRALRSLTNHSLVVPDTEIQAFTLVPLVADFLHKHKLGVIAAIAPRLEQRAYALIVENGYQKHERFPALNDAWPGVAPALPLFFTGPNDRLQEVCTALEDFLDFTGRWDDWLAIERQAETRAVAAGDHANAGWRAYQAGWLYSLRGQAEDVLATAKRAVAHCDQAFPPGSGGRAGRNERIRAIRLCGIGHRMQQNYTAAIDSFRAGLEMSRNISAESADVASALNDLAAAEAKSGDFSAAEQDFREALRVARASGFAEGVATYTGNLAHLALDREDWPAAEALAREALPLAEALGRQELIADDCHRIAIALLRQGRGAEGLPHAQRAVHLFTRLGMPRLAAAQTLEECGKQE